VSKESSDSTNHFLKGFEDPQILATYEAGCRRFFPAIDAVHRMTAIMLAERAPSDAKVLALGAGGGLELKALAQEQPGWRFVGVDPAAQMLRLAEITLGTYKERVELVLGYIDDAPIGPFDAAMCLLTLHFLDPAERERTLKEIRSRLKPGAPFVAVHGSLPQGEKERAQWLSRYAAFAIASGGDPEQVEKARAAIAASVFMLSPERDEQIMRDAGFSDITSFYSAFTWRGWVAYA